MAPSPAEIDGQWIATPDPSAFTGSFRGEIRCSASQSTPGWSSPPETPSRSRSTATRSGGSTSGAPPDRIRTAPATPPASRPSRAGMALNFPREYQWTDHDNSRVPIFMDITEYIRPGRNVLARCRLKHGTPAQVSSLLAPWNSRSGEIVPIRSNGSWRAEPVPPGVQSLDWTEPNHVDSHWRFAKVVEPPQGTRLRSFDPRIYTTPFRGEWIADPRISSDEAAWFEGSCGVAEASRRSVPPNRQQSIL